MGRRRYNIDEQKVQTFLAEGRGSGSLDAYRPWLKIQNVPSLGRSHRLFGVKTNRVHHLLSDGEWKVLLKLEHDDDVIDIQEQFPLNRVETLAAARIIGVKHPTTTDGTPYVMTIDFLVTYRTPTGAIIRPLTFKYSLDKLTRRDNELLDIARLYWKRRGLKLEVIDECFIDKTLLQNYDSVRAFHDISNIQGCSESLLLDVSQDIARHVRAQTNASLLDYCRAAAAAFESSPHVVFDIVRHLLAKGHLRLDLRSPVPMEQRSLAEFHIVAR